MKRFTGKLIAVAVVMIFVAAISAINTEAARRSRGTAKVIYLKGKAFQSAKRGGPWRAIRRGSRIRQGRYVKADKKSRVSLRLPDGSKVRVGPNSIVYLKRIYFNKKKRIRKVDIQVTKGMVYTKTKKKRKNKKDKFTVRTKGAVAGIRGTAFDMILLPQGVTLINCFQGEVWVGNYTEWLRRNLKDQEGYKEGSLEPKEISGPIEITAEDWVKTFGANKFVAVSPEGKVGDPQNIADQQQTDEVKEWEDWNKEQDKLD